MENLCLVENYLYLSVSISFEKCFTVFYRQNRISHARIQKYPHWIVIRISYKLQNVIGPVVACLDGLVLVVGRQQTYDYIPKSPLKYLNISIFYRSSTLLSLTICMQCRIQEDMSLIKQPRPKMRGLPIKTIYS